MNQYDNPVGPQRLNPLARLMQLVGLLNESADVIPREHKTADAGLRAKRKRERQNRRRGRLTARKGA